MTKYLVPCSCGKSVAVDASQAGLQVRCACGNELEVPTMRGLRQLKTADVQPAGSQDRGSTWGPRQGLMFLGACIAVIGAIAAAFVYNLRPQMDLQLDRAAVQADNQAMTLEQSWTEWERLRLGLNEYTFTDSREFQTALNAHRLRLGLAIGAIVVGVLLAVSGLLLPPARPARPSSRPTAAAR
jgi:hypothetical protein